MKLLTSLTASRDGSLVDATDENLIHDAACAHALMLAMEEWLGVSTNDECAWNVVTWIRNRADELLREWGFDSGEVAE